MEARRENGDGSGGESSGPPPPSSPPPSAVVHPAVAPWSYLLGRWRGEGEGGYPTINSFKYGEEILFSHSGKPVIAYTQKTWKLASGEPMHAQSGYWQPKPDGSIEVTIAQSTGLTEVQNCSYDAQNRTVTHQSELVGNASKLFISEDNFSLFKYLPVSCIRHDLRFRVFNVVDGKPSYVAQMATHLNNLTATYQSLAQKGLKCSTS